MGFCGWELDFFSLLPKVSQLFVSGREVHPLYSELFFGRTFTACGRRITPIPSMIADPADPHHERRVFLWNFGGIVLNGCYCPYSWTNRIAMIFRDTISTLHKRGNVVVGSDLCLPHKNVRRLLLDSYMLIFPSTSFDSTVTLWCDRTTGIRLVLGSWMMYSLKPLKNGGQGKMMEEIWDV